MKKLLIVLAAVAALGVALVAVVGAGAEEGDGPAKTFISKLADRLGISEEELAGAVKDTQLEMIDEAVADGKLTQDQADRLKERIEEGELVFPGRGRPGPRERECRIAQGVVASAAGILDMTPGDLVAELRDGRSLAQVAEENGMTSEELQTALLDAAQERLDQAVADGKLTQDQADRVFEGLSSNIEKIVNFEPEPGQSGPCLEKAA